MAVKFHSASFEVFGKVQGVFFRKYTKKTATKFSIVGWVMNTPQNTVTGCIQGKIDDVEKMKTWLKSEGSPKSRIERCVFKDENNINALEFEGFEIRK